MDTQKRGVFVLFPGDFLPLILFFAVTALQLNNSKLPLHKTTSLWSQYEVTQLTTPCNAFLLHACYSVTPPCNTTHTQVLHHLLLHTEVTHSSDSHNPLQKSPKDPTFHSTTYVTHITHWTNLHSSRKNNFRFPSLHPLQTSHEHS